MSDEVKVEVPAKFKSVVEQVEKLTAIELSELVKVLEAKFGVSAAAPMMIRAAGGARVWWRSCRRRENRVLG